MEAREEKVRNKLWERVGSERRESGEIGSEGKKVGNE